MSPRDAEAGRPRRRAIFMAAEKGGTGKSTAARALVDYARRIGVRTAAWDTDGSVGQLLQCYGTKDRNGGILPEQDPCVGAGYFNIRNDRQRDRLFASVTGQDAPLSVYDMPGGILAELDRLFDAPGAGGRCVVDGFGRLGVDVTVAVVLTPMFASAKDLTLAVKSFGDGARYAAIKNRAFGEPEDFVYFDGFTDSAGKQQGGGGAREIARLNGAVMVLPRLHPRTFAVIDRKRLSFADANRLRSDEGGLDLLDRMRLAHWLQELDAEIHRVGPVFGLAREPEPVGP